MIIEVLPLGMLETNCYIAGNDAGDIYIIDPGADAQEITSRINANSWTPKAILLTHAHFDHIGAVPEIAETYSIPVWLNPAEQSLYQSPKNAMPPWIPPTQNLPATTNQLPEEAIVPNLPYKVLQTPGHTLGGVAFYFKEQGTCFSGDTLFCQSVGRTDLPGGDWDTLLHSIRGVLFKLPDATIIYPGHGPETSIGHEKQHNGFVK